MAEVKTNSEFLAAYIEEVGRIKTEYRDGFFWFESSKSEKEWSREFYSSDFGRFDQAVVRLKKIKYG